LEFKSKKLTFEDTESFSQELHDTWTEGLLEDVEEEIIENNPN
jgi:hypothetical protein